MILSFSDFIQKNKLKTKATSIKKFHQILPSSYLNDIGIYLRDDPFKSDVGIINFQPTK